MPCSEKPDPTLKLPAAIAALDERARLELEGKTRPGTVQQEQTTMAFTGKASYDNLTLVGEDVSDLVALIAPTETPFLNLLSTAGPATSTWHQWTEELIGPSAIIASAAVNSATAATGILINATGTYLQVGMLLQLESGTLGSATKSCRSPRRSARTRSSSLVTRAARSARSPPAER